MFETPRGHSKSTHEKYPVTTTIHNIGHKLPGKQIAQETKSSVKASEQIKEMKKNDQNVEMEVGTITKTTIKSTKEADAVIKIESKTYRETKTDQLLDDKTPQYTGEKSKFISEPIQKIEKIPLLESSGQTKPPSKISEKMKLFTQSDQNDEKKHPEKIDKPIKAIKQNKISERLKAFTISDKNTGVDLQKKKQLQTEENIIEHDAGKKRENFKNNQDDKNSQMNRSFESKFLCKAGEQSNVCFEKCSANKIESQNIDTVIELSTEQSYSPRSQPNTLEFSAIVSRNTYDDKHPELSSVHRSKSDNSDKIKFRPRWDLDSGSLKNPNTYSSAVSSLNSRENTVIVGKSGSQTSISLLNESLFENPDRDKTEIVKRLKRPISLIREKYELKVRDMSQNLPDKSSNLQIHASKIPTLKTNTNFLLLSDQKSRNASNCGFARSEITHSDKIEAKNQNTNILEEKCFKSAINNRSGSKVSSLMKNFEAKSQPLDSKHYSKGHKKLINDCHSGPERITKDAKTF
ncbi:hypothetical protein RF11_04578 [Thelohanellus kitauei]|uniref:Uncharacterized protein n=1 Tax=Thelohanellus kitauei TaxID=669202 RepID=A0A0C2JXL5_THEKT|nr:hypothetical protein RF11_04578 [Thelohanellus kitauei]